VLDVGCGLGAVAFDLATAGAIVDGIDLNPDNIAEAKKRFTHPNLRFSVQDAMTVEPERDYDVVMLSNVLEHLHGRPEILRKLQKLSGAKRLLVRVPTFERDWRVPLKKELGVEWRLDLDHKTEYTVEEFLKDVSAAGLSIAHLDVRWGEIWSELTVDPNAG
jgi:trans-aconitate methyltransferase